MRLVSRIPAVFHFANEGRTVFTQLLDSLPKYEFDKCVARYHGNRRVRKLPAYKLFLVLAFAQLTWRESLRDSETCPAAFGPKLYHVGISPRPKAVSSLRSGDCFCPMTKQAKIPTNSNRSRIGCKKSCDSFKKL